MQTNTITIPMSDGSSPATYVKGSFHVFHEGTVYFNRDEIYPHVFAPDCVGRKTDKGLEIKSGKKTILLDEADVIQIPMKEEETTVKESTGALKRSHSSEEEETTEKHFNYVRGSFEIHHEGDTYLFMSALPLPGDSLVFTEKTMNFQM